MEPLVPIRHEPDYYAVLGVPRDATALKVEMAYAATLRRRDHWFMRWFCPDQELLATARAVLLDPVARRAYDERSDGVAGPISLPPA